MPTSARYVFVLAPVRGLERKCVRLWPNLPESRVNRARQLEVEPLRIDSFLAMGVEHRIVMTLVHITTHTVRYTFPKCYMGLCFPKRTVMDSKKRKNTRVNVHTQRAESVQNAGTLLRNRPYW